MEGNMFLLWIAEASRSSSVQTTYTKRSSLTSIVALAQELQKAEQIFGKLIIL